MVDYSKWKDIEISDDEDDTHPNIDTPSLFRWRHQARVERMEERKKEKEEFQQKKTMYVKKKAELQKKLETAGGDPSLEDDIKKRLADIEIEEKKITQVEEELEKKEKLTPWNIDTICREGFEKTIINVPKKKQVEHLTEEEKEKRMRDFVKKHEKELKHYGTLQKFEDSKRYLQDRLHLVCEDTANYLVFWCINLEMEEKHDLMAHVAHQTICMQFILELAKQLETDPRGCVSSFFNRIQLADVAYKKGFEDELESFKERIRKRAREKLDEAAEEERRARLGPGGLDPQEVFESLPSDLQKCFEVQDTNMLKEVIAKMPEDEARYHMKRCVDSGLWVPDANKKDDDEEEAGEDGEPEASGVQGESSSTSNTLP
ncbi:unnamed protein product [Darwinula stevensoni]|uniref:Hsp90 co-chaperone Cdc37 n=1 Tax=Darwinula stevensoni TaxID=69355 RepID=A0A7R9A4A5_9CRUS|nr:unnamed protein product [Darwinula stevensoni]CAG0882984.1 unnamed protein product [Darwinula stevensoni]